MMQKKDDRQMIKKSGERYREGWGSRMLSSGLTLLFPVLLLFLLGPLEVYYGNITDFEFVTGDFLPLFLGLAAIALTAGTFLLSLLYGKAARIARSLLLTGSLCAYLQYMFLNKQLAMGDGTAMEWAELQGQMKWNAVVWVLLAAAVMTAFCMLQKNGKNRKLVPGISAALSAVVLTAVVSCLIGIAGSGKIVNHYQLNGKNQMKVAPGENIIVLSLDSMERKVFEKVWAEENDLVSGLEDFTYYNQYDSLYLYTFPSLLHLLTGQDPDVSVNRMEYMKNAWTAPSTQKFYDTLHKDGYVCNVYTDGQSYVFGNVEYMQGLFDNLENAERTTDKKLMTDMMLKYSLYIYAPYIWKPRFEVNPDHFRGAAYYEDDIAYQNQDYYQRLTEEKLSIREDWKNAFIYEHIQGAHKPMNIDRNISYKENAEEDETVYGVMNICKEYLKQLKELGLYEDATIIILSDHGHDIENGPVFMIKKKGEHHANIQISTAPVTSDDFLATVLEAAGEDYTAYGQSISDYKEGERRERTRLECSDGFSGYTYYENEEEIRKKEDYDVILYRKDW